MIELKDVESVYSGIDGRCCCGCSGKHYYSSQYTEEAGINRGYPIDQDEVNDRMVSKVLNIVNNAEIKEKNKVFVSTVKGKRLYVVYLLKNNIQ